MRIHVLSKVMHNALASAGQFYISYFYILRTFLYNIASQIMNKTYTTKFSIMFNTHMWVYLIDLLCSFSCLPFPQTFHTAFNTTR